MRKNFIFYRSWYELLRQLPNKETRNEIYGYIVEYGLCGIEPSELKEEIKPIWLLIKSQLDTHQRNYELTCKGKSSNNSCKNLNNAPKLVDASKEREKERSKEKEKEDREDKEDKEGREEEKKKLNSESLAKKTPFSLTLSQDEKNMKGEDDMMARKTAFYETLLPFVRIYGRQMVRDFFDYWTEPTRSGTRMRFELQKTWSLERRLKFWESNERIQSKKLNEDNGGKAKITYI